MDGVEVNDFLSGPPQSPLGKSKAASIDLPMGRAKREMVRAGIETELIQVLPPRYEVWAKCSLDESSGVCVDEVNVRF